VEQLKAGNDITITDPKMTRFMMTLEDAVDLVLYAFEHGENGDLFVQKAPAATLDVLAKAIYELVGKKSEVESRKSEVESQKADKKSNATFYKVIGTRHGEKLYETLVTREEMAKAEDMGNYFRIPADNRDLNYDKYFVEGEEDVSISEDYHSHNTTRLDVEGMKELLMKLEMFNKV
jgi:UDP-glucose 4-epimerase